MYKVTVKSSGKYHNVTLGARYCLTKHTAINLAVMFEDVECDYEVEKLVRLNTDIFCWSEGEVDEKFWKKVRKGLDKTIKA